MEDSRIMFSGLVEQLGVITEISDAAPGKRLAVDSSLICDDASIGDSIAINGCCLTVIEIEGTRLSFEVGPETLAKTNLGELEIGSRVNLERSLALGDRLGGHLVTGHVDAVGRIDSRVDENEWSTIWFAVPKALTLQMASKGSVSVDGISLTLVDVEDERFSVMLIPHTLKVTTLGIKKVGDLVNIETDLLAKYVARQLSGHLDGSNSGS